MARVNAGGSLPAWAGGSSEAYLHPDSQFPDVGFSPGLPVVVIVPPEVHSSANLGGETVAGRGGDGQTTAVSGDVERVAGD